MIMMNYTAHTFNDHCFNYHNKNWIQHIVIYVAYHSLLCLTLTLITTNYAIAQTPVRFTIPQNANPYSVYNTTINNTATNNSATSSPGTELHAIPTIAPDELARIIREGQSLEAEERWTEVLAHYEAALRIYRNDSALTERYRTARFHCDITRRFHDASYVNLLRTMSVIETLNFFEETINHIQNKYVDMPLWESMFRHGIQSFCIALADENFRQVLNINVREDTLNAYLTSVQTTVNGWKIRDREDMKNGLLHIADGTHKQLGLNPVAVLMEFTCGVVSSLDPNTGYLTPNQFSDQSSVIYGNLVGIGVELRSDRISLLIVRVVPGSPAEAAGLKGGDRILAVDGISTRGRDTDNAANLLQGQEGTVVKLTIQSVSDTGTVPNEIIPNEMVPNEMVSREISITRRQIDVPSVEDVRMITDTLGYVKLTSFHTKTRLELVKALSCLEQQGMKYMVLDLRHNPGGLFNIGVEVASMFIEQGAIVRTQGRDHNLDSPCMARGETWRVPLIVLIDEESASAAEIVAGAIRDHERGIIIGRRSYGKGTIQQIIPIQTGVSWGGRSGLKLTTEKFYSPRGWPYSGIGVTPHIEVRDESSRVILSRPVDGAVSAFPIRSSSSSLDDPFIQEAVRVSQGVL